MWRWSGLFLITDNNRVHVAHWGVVGNRSNKNCRGWGEVILDHPPRGPNKKVDIVH